MSGNLGPVLVTGASSGIGRAITEHLSANGRAVIATVRKESDLAALAGLPHVTPVRLDVTHESEIDDAIRAIRATGRGLYGLVNNAGIAEIAPLLDTSVEDIASLLDVNLYGMHRMVRACFPLLSESHGRVVNIGSINGVFPEAFAGTYCISKYAVEAYSDVLRDEFSGLGIRVSLIEPGGFQSNISSNFLARKGAGLATAFENSPYREAMEKYFAQSSETPGEEDRTRYPGPRPVAEAVADALFSESPKPRYLVGTQEETDATLAQVLRLVVQLNQRHAHSLSTEELATRLASATP